MFDINFFRPQMQSSQLDDELLVHDKPIEQQELVNSEIINESKSETMSRIIILMINNKVCIYCTY